VSGDFINLVEKLDAPPIPESVVDNPSRRWLAARNIPPIYCDSDGRYVFAFKAEQSPGIPQASSLVEMDIIPTVLEHLGARELQPSKVRILFLSHNDFEKFKELAIDKKGRDLFFKEA